MSSCVLQAEARSGQLFSWLTKKVKKFRWGEYPDADSARASEVGIA